MRNVLLLWSMMLSIGLFAQNVKVPFNGKPIKAATKTGPFEVPLYKEISHNPDAVKWMTSVTQMVKYHEQPDSIDMLKAAKALVKASTKGQIIDSGEASRSRASQPEIGTNFLGNQIPYATPPDNALAISNGGRIVSSDNSTIEYYNQNGQYLMINESHSDFFNDNTLTGSIFDPRLIYDSGADRFIFVILHGSSSNNSKVLVAFSKTNNPAQGWWMYQLSGNPVNNNCWFDYPNIGISGNDLFISGNLFSNSNSFSQSVLYQIPKAPGYAGQSIGFELYSNIVDAQNQLAFTLVPASYGDQGNYGPGIYLTSSRSGGHNRIFVFDVTADYGNNPQLNVFSVTVPSYSPAADAFQPGNNPDLNNNDSRMQHCFYLDGMIHATHHGDYNNTGYNGVIYYRIPMSNPATTQTEELGQNGKDISFPSLAWFGESTNQRDVMIGYLTVSSSNNPGIEVVHCDNNMDFSTPATVRQGDTHINYTWTNGTERWGDYSDLQRKYNAVDPEVWMAGCFGATSPVNNTWNTWVAEIKGEPTPPDPVPVALFTADTTVGYAPLDVMFTDTSLNNPDVRAWSFQGGFPTIDNSVSPTITYQNSGTYDVQLIVGNQFGYDTLLKEDYITVLEDTTPVIPEFIPELFLKSSKVFPNPAKPFSLMHLDIELQEQGKVDVQIVDVTGRAVKVLLQDHLRPGIHRLSFNTLALSSGQYFVQMKVNDQIVKNEKIIID